MQLDRGLLLGFVGLLLVLTVMMVLPYVQFLLGAVILAFVLHPLHRRLEPRVGSAISAGLLVFGSMLAVVLPLVMVLAAVAEDATEFASRLQEFQLEDTTGAELWIYEQTGEVVDLQSMIQSTGENFVNSVFGNAVGLFGTLTHLLIGIGLFVFLLYYFVRDGANLVAWLHEVAPFPGAVVDELFERLHGITRAVLAGHVLVAIIQGTVAGIGLFAVGIPSAAFWTFVMIVLGIIPLIGTFAIWAPASLFLFTEGQVARAVGLAVYGTIVVGVTDDYLRPIVVDRYAQVSPAAIIIGVIGGMSAFGIMGLFVGPIVVAALRQSAEVYAKHYGREADQPTA